MVEITKYLQSLDSLSLLNGGFLVLNYLICVLYLILKNFLGLPINE